MWVRKQIDMGVKDLCRAMAECLTPGSSGQVVDFELPDSFLSCLSVRSGLDCLLSEVDWPTGSEVLMSAITISGMPRIVQHHGYQPVPVDITPLTLTPSVSEIRRRITPQTRAIILAHLTGGQIEIEPIARLCQREGLMLIDDRAQAYVGWDEMIQHSRHADVALWSFGPIKTAAALGGALISVRDQKLRQAILRRAQSFPVQTRSAYAARILKYALVRLVSQPRVAGWIAKAFQIVRKDHDQFAAGLARGFAGDQFFNRIRLRPSTPLTKVVKQRLNAYDYSMIEQRRMAGLFLAHELNEVVPVLGSQMIDPTYWLFAILVEDPESLVHSLWKNGFDATNRSSLCRVGAIQVSVEDPPTEMVADHILRNLVLLPLHADMPRSELKRMASLVVCQH